MQTTPHIWLTLSDSYWAETGVLALHTFVERLNVERRAAGRDKDGRETKLVVLCLNEECMRTCEAKGLWAYGGFIWSRPPKVSGARGVRRRRRELIHTSWMRRFCECPLLTRESLSACPFAQWH